MATSAPTNTPNLAALGIHRLHGSHLVRRQTVKKLRGLGFGERCIENSMRTLDGQIRATGRGQVMIVEPRLGPFGPIAIVETD